MESAPCSHSNAPDLFCFKSLLDPDFAVGDVDNVVYHCNTCFDAEIKITWQL